VGKILLVIAVFAVMVYGLFWLIERRRAKKAGKTTGRNTGPRTPPTRTLGPDDDVEFLRQLEQRRRRAAREQANKRPEDEGKSEQDQPRPE
jgi:FtsZ-interacting cell division protein ZipA